MRSDLELSVQRCVPAKTVIDAEGIALVRIVTGAPPRDGRCSATIAGVEMGVWKHTGGTVREVDEPNG